MEAFEPGRLQGLPESAVSVRVPCRGETQPSLNGCSKSGASSCLLTYTWKDLHKGKQRQGWLINLLNHIGHRSTRWQAQGFLVQKYANALFGTSSWMSVRCLPYKMWMRLEWTFNKGSVVVWMRMAPLGSYVWMIGPHFGGTAWEGSRGVILLEEVCH